MANDDLAELFDALSADGDWDVTAEGTDLLVRGRPFVNQLRQIQEGYRRASRRLTLEEWEQRSLPAAVLDNVARLTAALQ